MKLLMKTDMDAGCSKSKNLLRRFKKNKKQLEREKNASQGQISGSTRSNRRHHPHGFQLLPKVKRFPFLPDLQYAEFALSLYEKQPDAENTRFEVLEVLGVRRTLLRFPKVPGLFTLEVGDCCHVSLFAKPRHLDDDSKYFFFFELGLGDFALDEFYLVTFMKMKPDKASGLSLGCGFCPAEKEFPHPEGYLGGVESVALDPASQREMARLFKSDLIKSRQSAKTKRVNKSFKK